MRMTKEETRLAADKRSLCCSTFSGQLAKIILFLMALGLTASAQNPPAQAKGYTLVASTNFSPLSLSPNSGLGWYVSRKGGLIPCGNPSCKRGGYEPDRELHNLVGAQETTRKIDLHCRGDERQSTRSKNRPFLHAHD
jgi:hypothetical protein